MGCCQCERSAAVQGGLCAACAERLAGCPGLLPEHVSSRTAPGDADGWLIDRFGRLHALDGTGSMVGRQAEHHVIVLHATVSRAHARLTASGRSWRVRDLGSKNQTRVNGRRVAGQVRLPDGSVIQFGKVAFYFRCRIADDTAHRAAPVSTVEASACDVFGCILRSDCGHELQLLGGTPDGEGAAPRGALLYRSGPNAHWIELGLAPVEMVLLRVLCGRLLVAGAQPSLTRRCVTTQELARQLPFRSLFAGDDHVRQAVRRLRRTLRTVGVEGLVEAIPGHGYRVTWQIV